MKKLLLLFFMFVLAMTAVAQTTEKITYQAVVRDRTNRLVVYTPVRVDVTITYSSGSYFESLRDTTNANGLMYVLIGGNPGFENINWQRAVIKTVITIEGGETVSDEVVVTAVPLALQANYAMNVSPTAPTIVAVYNQLQADSLALANRITAERAHLDDTLSHYLMQEVQVLSISNDTIYLTGGSFVKLPAGFSGNYNDLTNLPDLNQYATNVHLNDTLSHYLMQEVQVLSVSNDTLYLTGGSWVKLPQGFSGNYSDLTNLPDLNQYATNVHLNDTLSHYLMQEVQVLSVSNDTLYLTGGSWVKLPQGFSGDYNDLTNLPDLNQYATNVHLNDTLKNYLTINGLCDSIKNCEAITNLQTADSLLGVRITRDSMVLSGKIYSDSVYLKGLIDSIKVNVTNNTTNITNNTTNISNITNNVTSLQVADSVLSDRFTRDSIALSNRLDTMFAHICDSIAQCDVITNLQAADSLLGNRITRDSILFYKTDSILANRITRDSILSYKADSILAVRITRDSIFFYKADSILSMRITADSINLVNNYYDKIKINDTVAYILSQITTASGNLNDNYYTKVEINDTLSHYTTTDHIDSLLGDYVKKDTLENYLTIAGLCDSIKNCDIITNLQTADSLLGVRITRDSILSYKTDSILAAHILIDSVVSYKTDSILSVRISTDSANLANNYYTKVEINDTLSHYTTSDNIDSLLGDFVKKDTLENYLTIAGLCDSIKNCEVITSLQTADSLLGVRITRDSILSYKADSILSARITADSINLVNNYYDKIKINDTVAYILSQITTASGNLNDNYYTKVEINDTLSHYTTTDRIDSLLGDYLKKDTLENYLTIAGLCDSIKNCEVITNLQTADSLLGIRITRDSILSHMVDSVLSARIINDSILFHKTDSVLLVHILNDSILSYHADSIILARILNDSILSHKADSILVAHILMDSVVSYRADSILSVRITADSANLANNYYTKVEINDTLSHYTTSDNIDSLLGDFVKKDTLENYLTIAGLCDSIKNCEVITNLQATDSLLGVRITRDSILSYKADSILADRITRDSVLFYKTDSILANRITRDSVLFYMADSILAVRITQDSILFYKADSILSARITADSINLVNNYYDKIKINDTVAYILSQITTATGNLNDNYYTKVEINDTLSHYTTTDRIDSLLGDYVKKDTLENYLTIAGLCDSIKNCEVITNLQAADSLLGVRITRDSILSYKADSILANRISRDSILSYKADSILANRITRDSILFYNADSVLSARITADSINLVNNYYDKIKINDTVAYILSQITSATGNLNDNYYTKIEINDTLSHYTTSDHVDSLLGDYVKKDTLKNYLTIAGLCDSIKNCDVIANMATGITTNTTNISNNTTNITNNTTNITNLQIADSVLNARFTKDSTILANRMDTLLKHVCDSVKPCVTEWMNDTLKAYTTSNKIDTLIQKYGYVTTAHLNDTLSRYTTTNKIDTLIQKYGYATTAHLNDTLGHYTTSNQVDTLLTAYEKKADLCNDVMVCIGDTLSKYTTSNKIDTLLGAYATNAHLNDTLRYYTTTNKIDTLIQKYGYATTAHLNDTLSRYTTTNKIDTLIQKYGYTTTAHLNDTLRRYTTTNQIDTLIKKYGYLTSDSAVIVTMRDSIQKVNNRLTYDSTKLADRIHTDSIALVNRIVTDSTALAHRMDTLLKHVCDSVKPCVTGWMNDTLKAYTTSNKIDTLLGAYVTNAHLNDTLSRYTTTNKIDTLIQKYGYTTTAHLNDTLRRYTTTNQIDTLIKKYGYLTSDSAVIVRMRDSIQKVNNRLTYDSTALAHRMDTLLKHVCDSVKPCVTGWMNDTLKAYTTSNKIDTLLGAYVTNAHLNDTLKVYTTTNKIDTLIQKYGYTTIAHLNDTLKKYTTSNQVDTLLNAYEKRADLCKDVMGCIGDTLSKYTTTNQIDTLIKKYGYLTSDSAVIVRMRDSIQKVNNRLTYDSTKLADRIHTDSIALVNRIVTDSTALAHRMDTLLKHVCDSVKPCVTGWMNDTLKVYTTTNKIDTLIQKYGYTTTAHLNDTLRKYTTSDHVDTLLNAYEKRADLCKDVMGCIGDTLSKYTTTNKIDTLIRKYGYLTSDSAVIVRMRDSIQKVNNRLTYDSTALAHRMVTLLKHVCDSVKPCVTGWMNDTLKAYTTSNRIDTLLGAYVTNAHLNDTLKVYTTTNKIDTLIQKYGYTTTAHLNDTLRKYTTSNQVDTLLNAYEKRADLCKDVMGCIGDTLSKYTTTNKIDTLIRKYGYLTSDSAVIVRMRDSIQKVNNRLTYDSTALAHRMDTLLKHVCDSVKPCVTGWMNDTLKVYTTTNKIDTLIQKYGYTTTAHLNDTLKKYTTSNQVDTLLTAYEKRADLCKDVMGCIGDTLSKYTTTNQIDTLIKKYGYLTSDSAVIVRMRDSIQKVNNRLTYDSTALAHRMDTLLKHVCDSVKPCVTGWIKDSTRMVFDSLHRYYTSLSTLADSMHRVDVRIKHDSLEVVELYKQAQVALQTLALKEKTDSLTLATRMDTVYKHLCDSVMNCDGIKTMQTNITDVTNNLDSSKTNIRSEISSLNTKLQSNIDSTSQHVRGALRDTAAAIRNSIGKGTLTIQYGTDDPVTFNANQKTDTSIIIPVPTAPNDATLTIQKNGTTVGTFTANQAADQTINITVPTCDTLAECDLIKSILARLDKLERQNDSLAKEIEKLKPNLTVTGPQKDTVCYGSTKSVTYTATFHNCSSSDYTLAWKVNGTDSSAVTGAVLTLNVENEGSYKVVCIATRSDNTFVTDTVTTIVSVDTKVPSFTVAITGLTVTLSNVTNTATIQWDTDSMPESFTSNTHTYSVADTITITATSERGCTFTKDTVLQPIAPVVTTDSVPANTIAATTAKVYGTVTSDGGIPETKRGILYSTSDQNLEFGANGIDSVMNGTGKGNYACTLERLVPCTQYYVRAFAYNEVDTVYGAILNFTTPSFTCGNTLYDIDGNDYETLLLGSQCWMKQNLRTTRYANGTEIQLGDCHSNRYSPLRLAPGTEMEDTLRAYGYLYNWYAANANSSSAANPSTVQGVCPNGWHMPSDAEWTQLTDFVASNSANVCGNDPKNIIKSLVSDEWRDLVGACSGHSCLICDSTPNNNTLFTVRSTGTWNSGTGGAGDSICRYTNYGHTIFTSATEYESDNAWAREFYTEHTYVDATAISKTTGMSVRCVLDCATDTFPPTVSTVSITNTGGTTVSMAANVDSDGGATVDERGVCWSDSQHPTISSTHKVASGTGIGNFAISEDLTTPGDTFYVRAYAKNSKGIAYGAEVTYVMPSLPTVTTADVTEILANTVTTGGEVTATGGISVTARGVCWSDSENNPTIDDQQHTTTDSSGLGSFVSHPMNLTPEHTYYVRAYATNAVGTAYGEVKTFTTPAKSLSLTSDRPATVKMCGASSQTVTYTVTPSYVGDYNYSWSCSGGASGIPDSNTYTVTYTSAATYTVTCMEENSGISKTISTTIQSGGTPVYLALCSEGLTISSVEALNSLNYRYAWVDSISWGDGERIKPTSGVFSHQYTSPGFYTVKMSSSGCDVVRTFALGGVQNHCTVAVPHSNSSTYTSSTGGLETVNSDGKITTIADNDNNTYKVVQIGTQCWMAENLRTTKDADGNDIPLGTSISSTGAYRYAPINGIGDVDPYGYFYNWTAVMDSAASASYANPSGVRGICPLGWHVPSDTEWTVMENLVNGSSLSGVFDWRGTHAAKLATGCDWELYYQFPDYNTKPNKAAGDYTYEQRDSSGFGARPAGCFTDSDQFGKSAFFWTSSSANSYYRQIPHGYSTVRRIQSGSDDGYSLRCVRDDGYAELEALPMATTGIVENIVDTSATLHGSVTIPNGVDVTERGFEYKPIGGTYTKVPADGTELTKTITGLTPNTSYVFRAFASTVNSTVYGDEVSFTTLLPPLSLTASPAVDTLIVWTGVEREITYTATFTNVNSSDYTISWKVNGTDSSAVTGQQLTVNAGTAGNYKVVCVATREGYTALKDSISTYVKVVGNVVDLSTLTSNYTAQNYDILTNTLSSNYKISIAGGATVVLRNVKINGVSDDEDPDLWAGISCEEGDVTIILEGTNTVKGFYKNYPGLYVTTGSTLTIQGTDTDTLNASSNGFGTGIGGGVGIACGNIEIEGGTINAYGGAGSAGIGGGVNASCGNISISGGKVRTIGGQNSYGFFGSSYIWYVGAGIGTGIALSTSVTCGNISISGGEVEAIGGNGGRSSGNNYGAGIGTGLSYKANVCGDISITGGHVIARGAHSSAGIGNGYAYDTWNACGNISISGETGETEVEAIGGYDAAGIGNGRSIYGYCECGDITIDSTVTKVKADKGGSAANSIGINNRFYPENFECGTVTVGGTGYGTGISTNPYIYEPTH